MARSVAELLPRPFAELTLEDVATIIATIGEERETLFFERKARVNGNALAKACSAFANTYGGLLVLGVADADDQLIGMEPFAAEAQLWVKDTLRSLVLPMPPFRARWLPGEGERGVLLVLVEESSATPHLLTRSGAIYVRNPGSSDPVPINDQRRLLDLAARGERARDRAVERARGMLSIRLSDDVTPTETLALAPTGVPVDFEDRLFARSTPDYLSRAAWGDIQNPAADGRLAKWSQTYVGVWRRYLTPIGGFVLPGSVRHGGVAVARSGAAVIYRGYPRSAGADPESGNSLELAALKQRFVGELTAIRDVLADLGAHGDLRLVYRLDFGGGNRYVQIDNTTQQLTGQPTIETWTTFDDTAVGDRVFAEIRRIMGVGPERSE